MSTHDQHVNPADETRLQSAMDRAAFPDSAPDWSTVLRTHEQRPVVSVGRRRWRGAVVAGAAVLAAATWAVVVVSGPHGTERSPSGQMVRPLSVKSDQSAIEAVQLPRIRDGQLVVGSSVRVSNLGLGEDVLAPLSAYRGPFAVSTGEQPEGIIFPTWKSFTPLGRSSATGAAVGRPSLGTIVGGRRGAIERRVLASGALAPVVSRSGRLAYAVGVDPLYRANVRYETRVVVRSVSSSERRTWTTTSGKYFPVAWAGRHLIVYQEFEGEQVQVLIFSGPGRMRRLADVGTLVAVSPDGRRIAVTDSVTQIAIVDVASAAVIARMRLSDAPTNTATSGTQGLSGVGAGSWRGSKIVVSTPSGLAVLDASGSSLRLVATYPTRTLPHSIDRPIWIDDDTVVGDADIAKIPAGKNVEAYTSGFVVCRLSKQTCATGDVTRDPLQWRRWVEPPNP